MGSAPKHRFESGERLVGSGGKQKTIGSNDSIPMAIQNRQKKPSSRRKRITTNGKPLQRPATPGSKSREENSDSPARGGGNDSDGEAKKRRKVNAAVRINDEVMSPNNRYFVKKKLGEGGFGAVYQVQARKRPPGMKTRIFALKTEARGPNCPDRLKLEATVLATINNCDDKVREHFAIMVDHCTTPVMNFIVMQLVGPSIQTIRDNVLHKEFSPSTALRISIESLEAIRCLHVDVGYLHRDLKPSNLTIGVGKNFTRIILIDFGISRKLFNKNNVIRLPRKEVKFMGTVRYACRRCHRHEEQGRQGDLESWFYVACDIYNQHVLPWRKVKERDLTYALKNDLRENDGNNKCLNELLPHEFRDLMLYIDKLEYEDVPDYDYLNGVVQGCATRTGVDLKQHFDWECFGPPPVGESEEDKTDNTPGAS
uniref:non-specific serine/threonine protein kinase n=1 Tax=Panagrellus redivivus TaxID=6233 RepID=A0A7E4V7S2_PANRE